MSIYKNGKLIAGGRQCMPLLSFMWADHQLNDISWLRADTFSWQSGAVYTAAYAHLADDITGKILQSETVGGTTIQFYLADDGHKICPASEESNVSAIYSATGVAWYYIIDTVNQQFKLPRTKYGITGLRDTVGGYIEPELPNIVASWSTIQTVGNTASGAFYYGGSGGGNTGTTHSGGDRAIVGFDASRSSSIYKDGATVQPSATQMYLYFYVGQFTQTATENTAGLNAEMFNDLNAHKVIDYQAPTADNGYTWYRKYADGWVEQGGYSGLVVTVTNNSPSWSVSLPVEMADNNYTAIANASFGGGSAWNGPFKTSSSTTTTVNFSGWVSGTGNAQLQYWTVSGIAAN